MIPSPKSLMILIAGPYRSGTGDDPLKLAANVAAMEAYALPLYRAGHTPLVGEWIALPLVQLAGSQHIGDAPFNEIFHPIAERLLARCDAVLRVGGPSQGADQMVESARQQGLQVFYKLSEIPGCEQLQEKALFQSTGIVTAVSLSSSHDFSKPNRDHITLIAGLGVEGDAHCGETVQHLSRVKINPNQPNLRQVHLIHAELHDEMRQQGFDVSAGQMGENITTRGINLLGLPTGTRLHLGQHAVVEVTGLRNPCYQIDNFQTGLLKACLAKDENGQVIRKAGIMGIVLTGGPVKAGDAIGVELPSGAHKALEVV